MKNTYFIKSAGLLVIASVIVTAAPFASAQFGNQRNTTRTQTPTPTQSTQAGGFCSRFSSVTSETSDRLSQKRSELAAKRAGHEEAKLARRAEFDQKKGERHTEADSRLNKNLTKMAVETRSLEQQEAAEKFAAAVEAAITTHRESIGAAQEVFRSSADKIMDTRQEAIKALLESAKAKADAAFEKARTDCAANIAPKTVQQTYITTLRAIRAQFQSDVKALEKSKTQMQALRTARKTAMEKANVEFKLAMQKAKADYKKVADTVETE